MKAELASLVILADDLSGAAETAATLAPATQDGIGVLLMRPGDGALRPGPGPVAVDTDTRYTDPAEALRAMTAVLSAIPRDRLLLKKVDSLLRGNLTAELTAVAGSGRTVVLAPALPRLDRVVRDGRPLVEGAPLAGSAAWRLEAAPAPTSLLDILPGAVPVPLTAVRDGSGLRSALRAAGPGAVLVCDAETDADLEQIAGAALAAGRPGGVAVAGSSALAAALGRLLGVPADSEVPAGAVSIAGRAAFIVGTAEPRARAQVAELRARGAHVLTLDPLRLLSETHADDTVGAARTALAAPVSVLTIDGSRDIDPRFAGPLSRRLADLVATAFPWSRPALLALTGGGTARAVLDALAVRRLTVRGTINGGAALSATDEGTTVVTRPGSFGTDDDLLRILERVSPSGYSTLST